MSATTGKGFSVQISAVDNASKVLDQVNKRIHALSAPAEKFGKSIEKFGEVSGLRRMSEGVKDLGHNALESFRSLDRILGPLSAITGAASVAGMSTLVAKWAEFGEKVSSLSYRLNTPVEKLGALRGAMRLAGGSAAEADQGMRGLQQTITGAAWGRNPEALQVFTQLGVKLRDAKGQVRGFRDVLGDVAESIKGRDADTQSHILEQLGLGGDNWLKMLKNGRAGLNDFEKQARATGGVMTEEMAESAEQLEKKFTALGMAAEGLGNAIADKLGVPIGDIVTKVTNWITANKDLIATKVADWVDGFVDKLERFAAWCERHPQLAGMIFGFAVGSRLGPAGAIGGAVLGSMPGGPFQAPIEGTPGGPLAPGTAQPREPFSWYKPWTWKGSAGGSAVGGPITPPKAGSDAAGVAQRTHDFWRAKGYTEAQVAGILAAGPAAESGFDPNAVGDPSVPGGSHGLYQHNRERWAGMQRRYGANPTADQQNEYAAWEVSPEGPRHEVGERLRRAGPSTEAADIWSRGFEGPANADAESARRGKASAKFIGLYDRGGAPGEPGGDGNVKVDVHLHNAPPGTSAQVTSSGRVTAPPPRIETPLPGVR